MIRQGGKPRPTDQGKVSREDDVCCCGVGFLENRVVSGMIDQEVRVGKWWTQGNHNDMGEHMPVAPVVRVPGTSTLCLSRLNFLNEGMPSYVYW